MGISYDLEVVLVLLFFVLSVSVVIERLELNQFLFLPQRPKPIPEPVLEPPTQLVKAVLVTAPPPRRNLLRFLLLIEMIQ